MDLTQQPYALTAETTRATVVFDWATVSIRYPERRSTVIPIEDVRSVDCAGVFPGVFTLTTDTGRYKIRYWRDAGGFGLVAACIDRALWA